MKHIIRIGFFIAGCLVGVFWGVNHPSEAARVANVEGIQGLKIRAEVSKAKIALLDTFAGDHPDPKYQQMKDDEKKNLDDTNKQLEASAQPGQ
jgi:hypothetical protein